MSPEEKAIRKEYLWNMLEYLLTINFGLVDILKDISDNWDTNPQEELFYQKSLELMENMNRANQFYLEWKELEASDQNDPSQP